MGVGIWAHAYSATLTSAIDAVWALIDNPTHWPATVKATRAQKQLRKALVTVIDVLKADIAEPAEPERDAETAVTGLIVCNT
jgi:hypothetical protein